jgi:hypothetical protein
MNGIKRFIKTKLVAFNLKPTKVIILQTGLVCEHFANGKINVI